MNKFCAILKPGGDMTNEEVRRNYRIMVKEHDPSRFPPQKRRAKNIMLMEINEAYLLLMSLPSELTTEVRDDPFNGEIGELTVQDHQKPDYTYYKYAMHLFHKGMGVFNGVKTAQQTQQSPHETDGISVMQTAIVALNFFKEAYKYFYRLVVEYPGSMWCYDANDKMNYLDAMNQQYVHLLSNMHR